MQPIEVSLGAVGRSAWIPVNRYQADFQVGLAVSLSSDGILTYSVQHTFDNLGQDRRPVTSITRATVTATVTDPLHKLRTGDSVIVESSDSTQLDGEQIITVVDGNIYTYACTNAGPAAAGPNVRIKSFRVFPHGSLAAQTASGDGNYEEPVGAIRLIVTAYTAGQANLLVMQGVGT